MKEKDLLFEKKYLANVIKNIREKLSTLGANMFANEEKIKEFQEYMWDSKADLDPQEMASVMVSTDLEWFFLEQKNKYFKKLYRTQNNPYFGRVDFTDENNEAEKIYIGITHLQDKDDNYLINDWRSPISSLFYDYELGKCAYEAPGGQVSGTLTKKRQYKIADSKLVHVFDNELNINDELLQEVLAKQASEKMKNIVNTIQKEQNNIIRNINNRVLVVQGIAGSGKTSVALHRIAFLLYKIANLSSKHVLIFSPNQIFTEYIANVLPELGEENTMQTTFHSFLKSHISEYTAVESFTSFISRYYREEEAESALIKYKQSDEIVSHINTYINNLIKNLRFTQAISENGNFYSPEELNTLFHERYNKFTPKERLKAMALKFSENNYQGRKFKARTYLKLLKLSLNNKLDYKLIYKNFYLNKHCQVEINATTLKKLEGKIINYEDANLFVYIKGLLEGFNTNYVIREIVVDEAQDYTPLQYLIINKIFKNAHFTILGDINQTINPYYHYASLADTKEVFNKIEYLELTKTYRSSPEIIAYSNQILKLSLVSAIRHEIDTPVLHRYEDNNLYELIIADMNYLKNKYPSLAIIAKDNLEAEKLYNLLKATLPVTLITEATEKFNKELIIIPAYIAKGLEFDSVIIYSSPARPYKETEKYLLYVAITRAQHELIVYN